jgi:SHS2 domain-containing protein
MGFSYKYLSDIAIADVAFEVVGDDLADILQGAAIAMAAVMLHIEHMGTEGSREFSLAEENEEDLLFSWLEELIYVKELHGVILKEFDITVKEFPEGFTLQATGWGEEIDPERHELGVDVKAVTYHMFQIWQEGDSYHARVVLDI